MRAGVFWASRTRKGSLGLLALIVLKCERTNWLGVRETHIPCASTLRALGRKVHADFLHGRREGLAEHGCHGASERKGDGGAAAARSRTWGHVVPMLYGWRLLPTPSSCASAARTYHFRDALPSERLGTGALDPRCDRFVAAICEEPLQLRMR